MFFHLPAQLILYVCLCEDTLGVRRGPHVNVLSLSNQTLQRLATARQRITFSCTLVPFDFSHQISPERKCCLRKVPLMFPSCHRQAARPEDVCQAWLLPSMVGTSQLLGGNR